MWVAARGLAARLELTPRTTWGSQPVLHVRPDGRSIHIVYVHLSTLRADGSPRNWVVWAGVEGDHILVCTSDAIWKARDMRHDPRVGLSLTDLENPYRMAAIQGRVVEVRPDPDCVYMDALSHKYTGAPFPRRGTERLCFVIAVERAAQRALDFTQKPRG